MKKNLLQVSLFALILTISSCDLFPLREPNPGCTDIKALNYDYSAEVDDGSCTYSNAVFYAQWPAYNGITIVRTDITVNGNQQGTISYSIYPNGPSNCFAPGTVQYQFQDGNSVSWNAVHYLSTGVTIFAGGTISPSSSNDCIKVNVTQ